MDELVLEKQVQSHRSVPLSSSTKEKAVRPWEVKSIHLEGVASTPGVYKLSWLCLYLGAGSEKVLLDLCLGPCYCLAYQCGINSFLSHVKEGILFISPPTCINKEVQTITGASSNPSSGKLILCVCDFVLTHSAKICVPAGGWTVCLGGPLGSWSCGAVGEAVVEGPHSARSVCL